MRNNPAAYLANVLSFAYAGGTLGAKAGVSVGIVTGPEEVIAIPVGTAMGCIAGTVIGIAVPVMAELASTSLLLISNTVGSRELANESKGKSISEGGSDLRITSDQNAVLELAKEAKNSGRVDAEDAKTIMEWAEEYGVTSHGSEQHLNRPQPSSRNWNFHIGSSSKTGHIPIIGDIVEFFGAVLK